MQCPSYDEVVERYNFDILKNPADFVTRDGDLAVTKFGDFMLDSPEYSALSCLVQNWRFNAPALRQLFSLAYAAKGRREEVEASLEGILVKRQRLLPNPRFHPRPSNPVDLNALEPYIRDETEIPDYLEMIDEIGASELGGGAYAGAVVLVLSGLLLSFKDDVGATRDDWEESAPLIGGCSMGVIVVASANNFRHRDEWAKTRPPTAQQLVSINALARAFQKAIAPDGSDHRFSRDICPESLDLISNGDFEELSSSMFTFANNITKRRMRQSV